MTAASATSPMGIEFLERHEGVVLKAYRCPAGVWTIGAGLTSASGVVKVTPGMRITHDAARGLLAKALARNYEPRVRRAVPGANQHEFDAAVSFDFNTGAIHRASWVKAFARRDWNAVRSGLAAWRKGGGKVLPGLVRRREEEYQLMRYARYGGGLARPTREGAVAAKLALDLSEAELRAVRQALDALGYPPGLIPAEIAIGAVRDFQRDHDLPVAGILGRAALSTLQRRRGARRKAIAPTAAGAGAGATTAADSQGVAGDSLAGLPDWVWPVLLVAAALWGLRVAWTYRDVVAAKIDRFLPRVAAKLRSL